MSVRLTRRFYTREGCANEKAGGETPPALFVSAPRTVSSLINGTSR